MPAAASASASSPPRPNTNGIAALQADDSVAATRFPDHQAVDRVLPDRRTAGAFAHEEAPRARAHGAAFPDRRARRTGRGPLPARRRTALTVSSSGSPGPAPTSDTRPDHRLHAPRESRLVERVQRLEQLGTPRLHRNRRARATTAAVLVRAIAPRCRDPPAATRRALRAAAPRAPAPRRRSRCRASRRPGARRRQDRRWRWTDRPPRSRIRWQPLRFRRHAAIDLGRRGRHDEPRALEVRRLERPALDGDARRPSTASHTSGATTTMSAPAACSAASFEAATGPPPTTTTRRPSQLQERGKERDE